MLSYPQVESFENNQIVEFNGTFLVTTSKSREDGIKGFTTIYNMKGGEFFVPYNDNSSPRQMHDVSGMNLKCAGCSAAVTELPFMPDGSRPVYCRDCNSQRRNEFRGDRHGSGMGNGAPRAPRDMQDVSSLGITCAGCGKAITELPFTPDPSRKIFCRDCYKNSRA